MKNVKLALLTIIVATFYLTSCTKDEVVNATDTNTVVASATIDAINELLKPLDMECILVDNDPVIIRL